MTTAIILFSVSCSAFAHLLLKIGMSPVAASMKDGTSAVSIMSGAALNPLVWAGIGLHVFALVTWLYVLSRVDVSYAYPFISLGFVIVASISYFALDEQMSVIRLIGMLVIVAGAVIISQS